jgi:hypothetical protein
MEQHIATIVAACSFVAACFSAYFANNSARAARVTNRLELIRRRFEVFNAVAGLHARLVGWDQMDQVREITPEVESAFLGFNVAVAQAEVLFPADSSIRALLDRIGRDASQIAIDRRESHHLNEMLRIATAQEQVALLTKKSEQRNRFYLSSLPELKDALRPYVGYEQLEK